MPGLGQRVLRFAGSTYDDSYTRLGGMVIPRHGDSTEVTAERQAQSTAQVIYVRDQDVEGAAQGAYIITQAFQFASPDDAAAFDIHALRQRLADDPTFSTVDAITNGPAIGDASHIFHYVYADDSDYPGWSGYGIAARSGASMIILYLDQEGEFALDAAVDLAEMQLACLTAAPCPDEQPVPASLLAPAATPVAPAPRRRNAPDSRPRRDHAVCVRCSVCTASLQLIATLLLAGLPLATGITITTASPAPVQRISRAPVHPRPVDVQMMLQALGANAKASLLLAPVALAPHPVGLAQVTSAVDPEAAAAFADLLAQAEAEPPDIGPATGELVERADATTRGMGGTLIPETADFLAVMTLVNPADTSTPWTAGFAFRYAPDGPQAEQILLAATGHIIVQHINAFPEIIGQATNIDPRPGARNTLELLAYGDLALIGVNGVPVRWRERK